MRSPLACFVFVLLLAPLLHGDMLPPGTPLPPPPTLEEVWEKTDAIVYGTAVRVQADASREHSILYDSTFRVERCWKGGISGDVRIDGGRNHGCYIDVPFRLRGTYLVLLNKPPGGGAYAPSEILDLRLSSDGAPMPEPDPYSINPFATFGDASAATSPNYNERALTILEFAERMAGHEAEAKRLHNLRRAPKLEQERLARLETEFYATARADLQKAIETESIADRKALLLMLQDRLDERHDDGARELKAKITAELSIAKTPLANGSTSRPRVTR